MAPLSQVRAKKLDMMRPRVGKIQFARISFSNGRNQLIITFAKLLRGEIQIARIRILFLND